ncbi:MAG TPA: diguanylate cyclase [Polyangia bacterium]
MAGGAGRLDEPGFFKQLLDDLVEGVCLVDSESRVTYWNRAAERLTGFAAAEVLGTRCCDQVLRHVDRQATPLPAGACPLAGTLADGAPRESATSLKRADGRRLPVLARVSPLLDAGGRRIGAVEVFSDNSQAESALTRVEELQRLALLDPVTEIGNRRFVEMQLTARFDSYRRYGWPFGVLFMDLDGFKSVNDEHGHGAGDLVLRGVARTLTAAVRSFDVVGRWGGDEFVAVVSNVTESQLGGIGRKLQRLVAALKVPLRSSAAGSHVSTLVTMSVGAALARADDTIDILLRRADERMYHGKNHGGLEAATRH